VDDARIPTTEQLVAELDWVRQLARALVRDAAVADDVAQDTWLVAHERQPDADRPLRPWLARVVTNLVRTRRTSEARRDRRDAAFDNGRTVPTPAELVERVELHRALADEVLALAEPYRSTVLLHFFEGMSSADIARKLGIPDGTVRRRLKVALDQLREALRERSDPPKGGWLAALVPLAGAPRPTQASALGAIAMKKLIAVIVVLVLLLLAGGGALLWRHRGQHAGSGASGAGGDRRAAIGGGDDGEPRASAIPAWMIDADAPSRRIAGRVVARGAPVAGAKVLLGFEVFGEPNPAFVMSDALTKVLQPIAEVTSAADGTFDFGVRPAASFTVSAAAPSYAASAIGVDNANPRTYPDQLVVALGECRMHLSGMIADASGGGIAKARIAIAGLSGTDSDANGNYSLCFAPREALGPPTAQVRVEADGYGTLTQTVTAAGDLHHDFLLVPEAVLVGRVVTSDGAPVASARVVAAAEPSEMPHHVASRWADVDADGRFRIAGLAPGAFQLIATSAAGRAAVPVVARPANTSREITLVLSRARDVARVSGHVFVKGAPAGGVFVQAVHGGMPARGRRSHADGSFVIDGVPYGPTRFFASPQAVAAAKELDITTPSVDGVRIDVMDVATVHGHITRGGKPVAGADIMFISAPQATFYGPTPEGTSDASGAYMLVMPFGVGQLVAWDMAAKAFINPMPIQITGPEDKTVDIELGLAGEALGTVVDGAGAPVPGVYVRLDLTDGSGDMCEAMTDAKGAFDCELLVGGDYRATVTPVPGGRVGFAPVDHFDVIHVPSNGPVTGIQLAIKDERLAIRGIVVDDTGAAMPDVNVEAIAPGDSTMDYPATLSDASGHFEIGNLARGTYSIGAHAADGSDGVVPNIAAGSTVTIKLARAGAIDGTLTGFASPPVVFVMADRPGGGRATVEGTHFSREALPPGRYTVTAMVGADVDAQAVEIRPGETAHVELHSRGLGTVEGTVAEFGTHAPVAGMRCDAHVIVDGAMSPIPPDPSQQAFTDATGHFVVSAPIGRVGVFCFAPNPGPLSPAGTDVDVARGARPNVAVFSVRGNGGPPGNASFVLTPTLPITVGQVAPPAASAGLRAGDQLVAIDGKALDGVLPVGAQVLVGNHHGGTVAITISRGGATRTVKLAVP
jgi:RNA polymerase sigma factor (sigma-70 family)